MEAPFGISKTFNYLKREQSIIIQVHLNKHYSHETLQKPYHLYHSKLMIVETYSIFFINLCIKTDLYLKFNVKYRFQGCTKLSNFLYTVKSCFSTFLSVLECLICEFSWQFFKRHTTDVDLCTSAIMIVKIVYFIVFLCWDRFEYTLQIAA